MQLRTHPLSVLWRVSTPWVVFYQAQQGESGWYDMQVSRAADRIVLSRVFALVVRPLLVSSCSRQHPENAVHVLWLSQCRRRWLDAKHW